MFNDELPVENVGDGEGTFVAGQANEYLGLKHAVTCPIAFVYLVREFNKLSPNDQFGWLDAQDVGYVVLAGILADKVQYSLTGILAAVEAGVAPEDIDDFASAINDFLEVGVDAGQYTADELTQKASVVIEEMVATQS